MRMLHSQRRTQVAYDIFTDPNMEGFFVQMASELLMVDMLFENGEYEKVIDVSFLRICNKMEIY